MTLMRSGSAAAIGEHVLDRLHAGHLGGVLAHQQPDVDALGGEHRVEGRRDDSPAVVVEPLDVAAEALHPGRPTAA